MVMPEHVHLLISEPITGSPSAVLKVLKQRISRYLRRRGRYTPDGQFSLSCFAGEKLARSWQPRFHDFIVLSAKMRAEKPEYMHAKPSSHSGRIVSNPEAIGATAYRSNYFWVARYPRVSAIHSHKPDLPILVA